MGCGSSTSVGPPSIPLAHSSPTPTHQHPRYIPRSALKQHATAAPGATQWTTIHGRVYDLTSFLRSHPGGAELLLMYAAGKDATQAYDDEHLRSHRANQTLATLYIGELVEDTDQRAWQEVVSTGQSSFHRSANDINSTTSGGISILQSFTQAEVAKHNREGDCWTIRRGQVYDLAPYFHALQSAPGSLPKLELARVAGCDATVYFESLAQDYADSITVALERGHVGFLAGHSVQEGHHSRRPSGASTIQPVRPRIDSVSAMDALNAIAADDLTHAAAEGLIASPSTTRYLWKLTERVDLTHDTIQMTFEPLVTPSEIANYRASLDEDELALQANYPVQYSTEVLAIRAGQHVSIEIPNHLPRENPEENAARERENRPLDVPFRMQRSYTPINSWKTRDENPTGQMVLIVKHYPGVPDAFPAIDPGAGSSYLHSLEIGSIITTSGTRGLFDIQHAIETYETFILIGGGSGLTPLYAILRALLRKPSSSASPTHDAAGLTSTSSATSTSGTIGSASSPTPHTPKQIILVHCHRREEDALLSAELDGLIEEFPDQLRVANVIAEPLFSPKNGNFAGHLTMDIMRFLIPPHLQPASLLIDETGPRSSTGSLHAHPNPSQPTGHHPTSSSPPMGALGSPSSTGSGGRLSRPRSPSRFTFGIPPKSRSHSPAPALLLGSDAMHVPDRLKSEVLDSAMRARAAQVIASSSRGHSRRPSVTGTSAEGKKAIACLCGPPAFNQLALSIMWKLGFKRGMGNTSGKDLFMF